MEQFLKQVIEFARHNGWAAFGVGVVLGLYLLGRDEEEGQDDGDSIQQTVLPLFANPDEEILYLEKRAAYLKQIQEKQPHTDDLLDELIDVISQLQYTVTEINKSKEGK